MRLSGQREKSEAVDFTDGLLCPIMLHGFLKAVSDFSTLLLQTHVNEVKHNHPAEITQSQLPGDFVNGLTVGGVGVGLGILGRAGTPRVHIDGHQSFGLINDQSTTRFQRDFR